MSGPSPDSKASPSFPIPDETQSLAARFRICSIGGQTDDPGEAMQRIVTEVVKIFRADAANFALINPDTGSLAIEYSHGFPVEHEHAPIPFGIGLVGWSAMHARSALVPEVTQDSRYLGFRVETRCKMVAPLQIENHLHGVFSVESDRAHAYTQEHLRLLETLMQEAAHVLHRLWMIEHLQTKAGQFEVLSRIAQEIVRKLEPDELQETVTRDALELTRCRIATLQRFERKSRHVRLQAIHPSSAAFASGEAAWPIEDCLAGAAITTRKQVEFANVGLPEYYDLHDIPERDTVVSVLSTPLIADREVLGVLTIYMDRPHRFSNDERTLLKACANLAAVALQNAQLYQRAFESEENLRNTERLTTLGLLAAEIAHETRNPLTVIRLLFGALNLEFSPEDPRNTDVAIMREKLDQLEAFVSRVLSVAKAPESLHSRWRLDDIIRDTCVLLRLKLSQSRIHLHYEPSETAFVVDANKGQLQQVLLNVILNATQATPEGGRIDIACSQQEHAGAPAAAIEISDTGPGIPPEYRDRIFDSFLSGRAEGTGLGLAIAKRIMRSHHGDIEVASTSPDGTVMRILLPLPQ